MTGASHGHVPALDGLRGLAVAFVLVHHLVRFAPGGALGALIENVAYAGYVGVDLFFVLSGFLITGILLASREAKDYYPRFLLRRSLRIFPLYFATLAFIFLVFRPVARALGADPEPIVGPVVAYVLYVSNFAIAHAGHFGWRPTDITWSLAIEEQFYLVFPWVVRALSPSRLVRALVVLAGLAIVIRTGLYLALGRDAAVPCYVLPFCRMDALALGGLVATLEVAPDTRVKRALEGLASVALVVVPVLALTGRLGQEDPFTMTIGYTIVALAMVGLVVRTSVRPTRALERLFTTSAMTFLGTRSYGIYLFHSLIEGAVRRLPGLRDVFSETHLRDDVGMSVAFTITSLVLTLIAAQISFVCFEKPVLSLRDRVRTLHKE